MINWFNIPDEGLSNGGLFEVKELEVTENGTYETKGEMYNKVTVNVEGGGGSSDFSTANVTIICNIEDGTTFEGAIIRNNITDISQRIYNGSNTITCILYKGENYCGTYNTDMSTAVITGNARYSTEDDCYIITGDCTITIS